MLRYLSDPSLVEVHAKESLRMARERFDVRKVNAAMMQAMGLG